MASIVPLRTLPLEHDLVQRMESKGIHTAENLFQLGVLELSETLDIGPPAATHLLELVANALMHASTTTLWSMHSAQAGRITHLSTLIPMLDQALRGGMPCGRITELVGPAGVGKTQLCFTLAVAAVAPPVCGNVVYIDVEHKFSAARVYQLAAALVPALHSNQHALQHAMANIQVLKPSTSADLLHALQGLGEAVQQGGVQLILLDSIAAAVRSEFGSDELWQRQRLLGEMASLLKTYAETANVPVVVTNQITTALGGPPEHALPSTTAPHAASPTAPHAAAAHVTASLGTVWAHAVSCRLVLEYTTSGRCCKVVKAPDCPFAALEYQVTSDGLEMVRQAALPLLLPEGGGSGSVLGMAIGNVVQYAPQ